MPVSRVSGFSFNMAIPNKTARAVPAINQSLRGMRGL